MAIIPKPKFPNIPRLPGVPQILRSPVIPASAAPVALGAIAIGRLWQALTAQVVWGIFDQQGNQLVTPDNVQDFGYRSNFVVTTAPVQRGSFFSANKVATPFEPFVRLTKGGSESERQNFINDLEGAISDIDAVSVEQLPLRTVMTPERAYENVTIVRYELYRRGAQGAFFIDADVYLQEIRQIQPQYTSTAASTQNAQNIAALPPINQLRVQALTPGLGVAFDAATSLGIIP